MKAQGVQSGDAADLLPCVTLTSEALSKIKQLANDAKLPACEVYLAIKFRFLWQLRSFRYLFEIVEHPADRGRVVVQHEDGVDIAIDRRSAPLLKGCLIDWRDQGFVFLDPAKPATPS